MLTGTLEGWKKWMLMTESEQKKLMKEYIEQERKKNRAHKKL